MKTNYLNELEFRYEQVREQIQKSAHVAKKAPDLIKLVVVTKTHPLERIFAAIEVGIRDFGENYPEEAVGKINAIGAVQGVKWHMIGHVQGRKADLVARNFSYIHSLDSFKLAERLNRFALEFDRKLPVFIECNISGEESKYGYSAFETRQWESLLLEMEKISQLSNLRISGLMAMPPLFEDAERTRPYFRRLRELREYLAKKLPSVSFEELSMGTSADYAVAIEEGATIIRVGTAILGPRPPRQSRD